MPLGREKVRLHWQVAPLGTAFTAASGVISGTTSWTDTLPSGLTCIQEVSGFTSDTPYHPPASGRLARAAAVPPQPTFGGQVAWGKRQAAGFTFPGTGAKCPARVERARLSRLGLHAADYIVYLRQAVSPG